ncbi:MAG: DUF4142 domain-containing protein [Ferruginibacter sp.]
MKKIIGYSIVAFAITAASCNNGDENKTDSKEVAKDQNDKKFDSTNTEGDAKFAVTAADGGMLEVKLGQLAQANGSSAGVKDFGKMMVTDHSKGGDELKALAQKYNITIPAALSNDAQKTYDELAAKKGADFDKAYTKDMIDDHEEDIKLFQKEANDGNNGDLKTWASATLPTLQHHLDAIKSLQETTKNK